MKTTMKMQQVMIMKKSIKIVSILFFAYGGLQAQQTPPLAKLAPKEIDSLKELCLKKIANDYCVHHKNNSRSSINPLQKDTYCRLPAEIRMLLLEKITVECGVVNPSVACALYEEQNQQERLHFLLTFFNAQTNNSINKKYLITLLRTEKINEGHKAQDQATLQLFKDIFDWPTVTDIKDYKVHYINPDWGDTRDLRTIEGKPISRHYPKPTALLSLAAQRGIEPLCAALLRDSYNCKEERVALAIKATEGKHENVISLLIFAYSQKTLTPAVLSEDTRAKLNDLKRTGFDSCFEQETPLFWLCKVTSESPFVRLSTYAPFFLPLGTSINTLSFGRIREGDEQIPEFPLNGALDEVKDCDNCENVQWLLEHGAHVDLHTLGQAIQNFLHRNITNLDRDQSNLMTLLQHVYQKHGNSWQRVFDEFLTQDFKLPVAMIVDPDRCKRMIEEMPQHAIDQIIDLNVGGRATLLMMAAALGAIPTLQLLHRRGANPLAEGDINRIALNYACVLDEVEAVKTLLELGPASRYQQWCKDVDQGYSEEEIWQYCIPEIKQLLTQAGLRSGLEELLSKAAKLSLNDAELDENDEENQQEENDNEQAAGDGHEEVD